MNPTRRVQKNGNNMQQEPPYRTMEHYQKKVEFINNGDRTRRGAVAMSPKNGKRSFSLEALMVLICLTLSLLILPLILPPLPPPPFMLLLLPIGILALLMVLAFMPSEVRDLTHTYM